MKHASLIESFPEAASLMAVIESRSKAMTNHRVFGLIKNIDDLRTFMSWHVFAVWDFMSLVKRLQIELTSVTIPWTPPRDDATARFINEIVLGEETDIAPDGQPLSHYHLYVAAMEEIGTSTLQIKTFTDLIAVNIPVADALQIVNAPAAVREFVTATITLASKGSVEEVLGGFVFGREDAIPEMFQSLMRTWHLDVQLAPKFVFYLERHIALDGDEHGPAAMRMLTHQVDGNSPRLLVLLNAAIDAIEHRIRLWDALADALVHDHARSRVPAEAVCEI